MKLKNIWSVICRYKGGRLPYRRLRIWLLILLVRNQIWMSLLRIIGILMWYRVWISVARCWLRASGRFRIRSRWTYRRICRTSSWYSLSFTKRSIRGAGSWGGSSTKAPWYCRLLIYRSSIYWKSIQSKPQSWCCSTKVITSHAAKFTRSSESI